MGPVLNSSFLSMKQLGVLLLPPGWDASPPQGYPQHICWYTFVHLGKEKHCESKVSCLRTTQWPQPGFEPRPPDPESSILTMRPPRLPTYNRRGRYNLWEVDCSISQTQCRYMYFNYISELSATFSLVFFLVENLWGSHPMEEVLYTAE